MMKGLFALTRCPAAAGVILALLLLLTACGGSADDTKLIPTSTLSPTPSTSIPPAPVLSAPAEDDSPALPSESPSEAPPEPEWDWQTAAPEDQGLNGSALPAIHADYDSFPLLTAVIVKNGYIVDEYYKDGYDEDSRFVLNSASKSVTSALVGIAIDQGYIEGVDVPLSEYLPQLLEQKDGRWRDITLWHLLTHTSGIASTDSARWYEWRGSENWLDYILALPIEAVPGTKFNYSTGNTHLLCAALQQATGMILDEFGREYLFGPVGMDSARFDEGPQGISDGGNGIWMTPRDMARFGQLYLQGGVWEGGQVVPAQWVEDSTSVQFRRSSGSADYGYQWWVRTFGAQRYPAYFAQGHGGQYIFVVPELELVVAFTSNYEGRSSIYWQLVNDIVAACDAP